MDQVNRSVIFIIEDETVVSASIGAMLEAAGHSVKRVCDAACFSSQYLHPRHVCHSDVVMIHLDGNQTENYQLLNLLLEDHQGPSVIVIADDHGTLRGTDQFRQSRFQILPAYSQPETLLKTVATMT